MPRTFNVELTFEQFQQLLLIDNSNSSDSSIWNIKVIGTPVQEKPKKEKKKLVINRAPSVQSSCSSSPKDANFPKLDISKLPKNKNGLAKKTDNEKQLDPNGNGFASTHESDDDDDDEED